MAHYKLIRLSATLLAAGNVGVTILTLYVHPAGGDTLAGTFTNAANSHAWTAIHLGQFASWTALLAGLVVLVVALGLPDGAARWVGMFGAGAAGVALAMTAVLFAVAGVANKRAVDAWASAPPDMKATRIATAEALRWLEIGVSSYLDLLLGAALTLVAITVVWTAPIRRPVGLLMGLSGVAFMVLSWLVATTGFTQATTVPSDIGFGGLLILAVWLYFIARRPTPTRTPADHHQMTYQA
jgi:hypothetical protein